MVRLLLTLSAASFVAFWIVAIASDWDAGVELFVLLVLGLPSAMEPVVDRLVSRKRSESGS